MNSADGSLKLGHQDGIRGRAGCEKPSSLTCKINDGVIRLDDQNNHSFWIEIDMREFNLELREEYKKDEGEDKPSAWDETDTG